MEGLVAEKDPERAKIFLELAETGQVTHDWTARYGQAFAGLLWSKQYYYFDVDRWLKEKILLAPSATSWQSIARPKRS